MNNAIKITFVKDHPDAQLPKRNHDDCNGVHNHDAGFDIFCCEDTIIPAKTSKVVNTGIKVGFIEPGYWFKIEARSGLGFKHGIQPHPGIIDTQYRGPLSVKLYNLSDSSYQIKAGDRIAQFIVYKLYDADISWAENVDQTARGENKLGSSGS